MANYAIHDGTRVLNVIVAETADIAEEVTGMAVLETEGIPWIDWTLEEEGWRPPSPFPSWVWNGDSWNAPISYPTDGISYHWDETQGAWLADNAE